MPKGNRSANRGHRASKAADEKHVSRRISLPPQIDKAVVALRGEKEAYSTALARLLNTHPEIQEVLKSRGC